MEPEVLSRAVPQLLCADCSSSLQYSTDTLSCCPDHSIRIKDDNTNIIALPDNLFISSIDLDLQCAISNGYDIDKYAKNILLNTDDHPSWSSIVANNITTLFFKGRQYIPAYAARSFVSNMTRLQPVIPVFWKPTSLFSRTTTGLDYILLSITTSTAASNANNSRLIADLPSLHPCSCLPPHHHASLPMRLWISSLICYPLTPAMILFWS